MDLSFIAYGYAGLCSFLFCGNLPAQEKYAVFCAVCMLRACRSDSGDRQQCKGKGRGRNLFL